MVVGEGDYYCYVEGGVQVDFWVDFGDDGEGDGFGDQCKGDDQVGEQVVVEVGELVLFQCLQYWDIQG